MGQDEGLWVGSSFTPYWLYGRTKKFFKINTTKKKDVMYKEGSFRFPLYLVKRGWKLFRSLVEEGGTFVFQLVKKWKKKNMFLFIIVYVYNDL